MTRPYNAALRLKPQSHLNHQDFKTLPQRIVYSLLYDYSVLLTGRLCNMNIADSRVGINPDKVIHYDYLKTKVAKLNEDAQFLYQKHAKIAMEANLHLTYTKELDLFIGAKCVEKCLHHTHWGPTPVGSALPKGTAIKSTEEPMWQIHIALHTATLDRLKELTHTIEKLENIVRIYKQMLVQLRERTKKSAWDKDIFMYVLDDELIFQKLFRENDIISKSELEAKTYNISGLIRALEYPSHLLK